MFYIYKQDFRGQTQKYSCLKDSFTLYFLFF